VKEKGIPFLKMSSYVKTGSSSDVGFEVQGALRNPAGFGDMLKISSQTSQNGSNQFSTK
jgi:hypothetical protein